MFKKFVFGFLGLLCLPWVGGASPIIPQWQGDFDCNLSSQYAGSAQLKLDLQECVQSFWEKGFTQAKVSVEFRDSLVLIQAQRGDRHFITQPKLIGVSDRTKGLLAQEMDVFLEGSRPANSRNRQKMESLIQQSDWLVPTSNSKLSWEKIAGRNLYRISQKVQEKEAWSMDGYIAGGDSLGVPLGGLKVGMLNPWGKGRRASIFWENQDSVVLLKGEWQQPLKGKFDWLLQAGMISRDTISREAFYGAGIEWRMLPSMRLRWDHQRMVFFDNQDSSARKQISQWRWTHNRCSEIDALVGDCHFLQGALEHLEGSDDWNLQLKFRGDLPSVGQTVLWQNRIQGAWQSRNFANRPDLGIFLGGMQTLRGWAMRSRAVNRMVHWDTWISWVKPSLRWGVFVDGALFKKMDHRETWSKEIHWGTGGRLSSAEWNWDLIIGIPSNRWKEAIIHLSLQKKW